MDDLTAVERRFLQRFLDRARALDNTVRGIYAEELVAEHLPEAIVREGWSGWDIDWRGIKIEVKCAGKYQSWHHADTKPSVPRWSVPERRAWDPDTDTFSDHAARHADVYVFCLHESRRLDEGWSFYVASTAAVSGVGSRSFGRTTLERIARRTEGQSELANLVLRAAEKQVGTPRDCDREY